MSATRDFILIETARRPTYHPSHSIKRRRHRLLLPLIPCCCPIEPYTTLLSTTGCNAASRLPPIFFPWRRIKRQTNIIFVVYRCSSCSSPSPLPSATEKRSQQNRRWKTGLYRLHDPPASHSPFLLTWLYHHPSSDDDDDVPGPSFILVRIRSTAAVSAHLFLLYDNLTDMPQLQWLVGCQPSIRRRRREPLTTDHN